MKKNLFKLYGIIFISMLVTACAIDAQQSENFAHDPITADVIFPEDYGMIKTSRGASDLDLEKPLRCAVNWKTQEMVATMPFNISAFNMVKNGPNDVLPRFEVTGFSFDTMSAEKALARLTKEAGIKVIAKDGPYAKIAGEDLKGEFADVINMITEAGDLYYSYNAEKKTITLSHKANFSLFTPKSRPIVLGLLDVLRGSGITDATTDWSDYSITFNADYELKNKIMSLIKSFEDNPTLIAYDISVFRIYPYDKNSEVNWQNMLDTFNFGTIKTTRPGVIGRVLTTSNDLNVATLQNFLANQAFVIPVSEGKFVVPNLWFARFDVGRCGEKNALEHNLSILAKSSIEQQNRIFSEITLESEEGQITKFDIRSKIGENFMIIGIPNDVFGVARPRSETVVFIVPRLIRTVKTSSVIKNSFN